MRFQLWVLFTLSCLIPRRLGTIIYIHNTTNKNNMKITITINLKLICKLWVKWEQQCKNQEQKKSPTALAVKHNEKSSLARPPENGVSSTVRSTLGSANSVWLHKPWPTSLPQFAIPILCYIFLSRDVFPETSNTMWKHILEHKTKNNGKKRYYYRWHWGQKNNIDWEKRRQTN